MIIHLVLYLQEGIYMSWTGYAFIYPVIFWDYYWFILLEFIKKPANTKGFN